MFSYGGSEFVKMEKFIILFDTVGDSKERWVIGIDCGKLYGGRADQWRDFMEECACIRMGNFVLLLNYINPLEMVERSFEELCKGARCRIKVGHCSVYMRIVVSDQLRALMRLERNISYNRLS